MERMHEKDERRPEKKTKMRHTQFVCVRIGLKTKKI